MDDPRPDTPGGRDNDACIDERAHAPGDDAPDADDALRWFYGGSAPPDDERIGEVADAGSR